MSEGLKACPYYGVEPSIWKLSRYGRKHVSGCYNEECKVNPRVAGDSKKEAVDMWNSRAPQHPVETLESINEETIVDYMVAKGYVVSKGLGDE